MTEIGPSMYMPIEAEDMVGSESCGIPCPFRECRIADEEGDALPPDTVGELLVRGPGILKGYYNNPEATRESVPRRLVPHRAICSVRTSAATSTSSGASRT